MTCQNCYHCNICQLSNSYEFRNMRVVEAVCPDFKDKSRIIELPCEVGTELFLSDYLMAHHRLKEYKFIGTRVVMVIECFEFQRTCKRSLDEHYGKLYFLLVKMQKSNV